MDQNGEIISLPDEKGDLQVQVGDDENQSESTRYHAHRSCAGEKEQAEKVRLWYTVQKKSTDDLGVDLMSVEKVLMSSDGCRKYIDDAFISGLEEVTIIHGRGEGILRKGIQEALKRNKNVKGFGKGSYHEGGDGVTVVKLR